MEQFKYKANFLHNAIFDDGFVYSVVTKEIVEEFNLSYEDAAATVNLLGGIRRLWCLVLVIEYPNEIRLRIKI